MNHELKKIIDPVIQRNSYFAHPENVILAMITDHQPHIRELRFRKVMNARVLKQSRQIRKFKVSAKLNFDATKYYDIIDWNDVVTTEPPVIKTMKDADLQQFIALQVTSTVFFRNFHATHRLLRELES